MTEEMSVWLPRRAGFRVAWVVLCCTLWAYLHGDPHVQFVAHEGEPNA